MSGLTVIERAESVNVVATRQNRQAVFSDVVLPLVLRYAAWQFRELRRKDDDSFEDASASAVAHAWEGFCKADDAGKNPHCFPAAIAAIACRRVRCGRKVGTSENIRDVLRGAEIGRAWLELDPAWEHACAASSAPVPDQVAFRIDFPRWLDSLSERDRALALELSEGSSTGACASMFGISPARVSQKRREFMDSWEAFTE